MFVSHRGWRPLRTLPITETAREWESAGRRVGKQSGAPGISTQIPQLWTQDALGVLPAMWFPDLATSGGADRERCAVSSIPTALLLASSDCQVRRWFYFFSNTSRSYCTTQPAIPPTLAVGLDCLSWPPPDLTWREDASAGFCGTTLSGLGLARRVCADRFWDA